MEFVRKWNWWSKLKPVSVLSKELTTSELQTLTSVFQNRAVVQTGRAMYANLKSEFY
jgi:hypothetical protein